MMNWGNLIEQARESGGVASTHLSAQSIGQEAKIPETSSKTQPAHHSEVLPQAARLPRTRRTPFTDFIADLDFDNRAKRVLREHEKNQDENINARVVARKKRQLANCDMLPLNLPTFNRHSFIDLPRTLVHAAEDIAQETGLDVMGLCQGILGAVSIATWGRITVELEAHWQEASVGMLIHISPSGTRKSTVVAILRAPFDAFRAQANEEWEKTMPQLEQKAQLRQQATDKFSQKIISESIKAMIDKHVISNTDTVGKLKEVVLQVFDLKEEMMQDITESLKPPVRLLVDNATPFKLALTLQEQGECQGCITAEGSMIQSHLLSPKGAANLFLRGHTQEPYVYDNDKQQISLLHPALPMVNFVQNTVAAKFYGNDVLNELGVTARFVPYFHGGNEDE